MRYTLAALVALLLTSACGVSSTTDIVAGKGLNEGTSQVHKIAPAQAWIVAHNVLRAQKVDPIEDHQAEGYMLTSTPGIGWGANGCYIGVWIEATAPAPYSRVTVVTKRRWSSDPVTGLTESTFQKRFAEAITLAP